MGLAGQGLSVPPSPSGGADTGRGQRYAASLSAVVGPGGLG